MVTALAMTIDMEAAEKLVTVVVIVTKLLDDLLVATVVVVVAVADCLRFDVIEQA